MDSIPIFVPNFPPPCIQPNCAPPIGITHAYNSNSYKERLQTYLQSRRNRTSPPNMPIEAEKKPLKLSKLSNDLSNFYGTIESIKAEIDNLSNCASSIDNNQWCNQITSLKIQLNELSATSKRYQNPNLCNNAKRAVEKRLKKRNRLKKRQTEMNALKKCAIKNRELKHQQIDQRLNENIEKIQENRRQIESKQRAEEVLTEVKSLKNDATKYVQTFDSLKELYRVRNKDKALDDREFNREIEKLKKKWLVASEKYETEEKRLRIFLNCSNHLQEWHETIFGDMKNEDIFLLKKNENGLGKLIEIRSQWDRFIVSDENPYGSSIPLGWVMPNANPTNQWKPYLKYNDQ